MFDNAVDHIAECLLRLFRKTSCGGFNGIRHHNDGRFLRERFGARVLEAFKEFGLRVIGFVFTVEVFHARGTVMRANEIYDDVRELVFLRQFYPLPDMSDDDFCTFDVAQFVVGRSRRALIFGEILCIRDLADVVVQSSCADQQGVSANEFCGVLSKVSDLHGVLESTWSFFGEAFEQWVVRVGKFE